MYTMDPLDLLKLTFKENSVGLQRVYEWLKGLRLYVLASSSLLNNVGMIRTFHNHKSLPKRWDKILWAGGQKCQTIMIMLTYLK